jgi:hypothetical protein
VDKSNLLRLVVAACVTLAFMGAAQAGQVKEKDLSDVVSTQDAKPQAEPIQSNQGDAADDAKDGFSSGAKGLGNGFKQGAVATGHGFKWLGNKMGSGLKTAGVSIKNFFTGKYFGFGKKDSVEEQDLSGNNSQGPGEAKANPSNESEGQLKGSDVGDDLEMEVDPKGPKSSDWAG